MAAQDHAPALRQETNHSGPNGTANGGANGFSLQHTDTAVTIPRDVFEKLYLQPQNPVAGDLRKRFANPTPLALVGFVVSAFPLACDLLGWRGAGGYGAASVGTYLYMGGLLQILASVGEWILGNTFSFVVFGTIGGFWLSFGATLQPYNNAQQAYGADTITPDFAATYAFFLVAMAIVSFMFLVCSLRTNVVLVFIFTCLVLTFGLLAGAYWNVSLLKVELALKLQKAGGGVLFALSVAGFALLFALLLESVDFPFSIPVIDLSERFKGKRQIAKAKREAGRQD